MSENKPTNQNSDDMNPPEFEDDIDLEQLIDLKTDAEDKPQVQELDLENIEIIGGSEVDELKEQLADAEKRVLLAQADLENFRRRTRRDAADQVKYASLNLMNEILESVDNLQRAVESYQQEPNGDGLVEGVKMVAQQISTALENHGCKKIEAIGQPFDPNLHQALQMQPSDEHGANTVMMDLRSGYQLHDRVVRPSQVFVSTGPQK